MQRGSSSSTRNRPTSTTPSIRLRFPGDGLDHRRPVMANSQPIEPSNFVDLTTLDDVDSDSGVSTIRSTPRSPLTTQARTTSSRPTTRLPRFPDPIFGDAEVIDLEELPDLVELPDPHPPRDGDQASRHPLSPEIQFLHERPIPPGPRLPPLPDIRQQMAASFPTFPSYVDRSATTGGGRLRPSLGWRGTGMDLYDLGTGALNPTAVGTWRLPGGPRTVAPNLIGAPRPRRFNPCDQIGL